MMKVSFLQDCVVMVSMRAPFPSLVRSAASRRQASSMSRSTMLERSFQAPQAYVLTEGTMLASYSHTRKSQALGAQVGSHGCGGFEGAALSHALLDRAESSTI